MMNANPKTTMSKKTKEVKDTKETKVREANSRLSEQIKTSQLSLHNPNIEVHLDMIPRKKIIYIFTQWFSKIIPPISKEYISDPLLLTYYITYYNKYYNNMNIESIIIYNNMNNIESIIKIQKWFRKYNYIISNKFKLIIEILNKEPEKMKKTLFEIIKISKLYPPRKNENKFIYGKLIEKSLINTFTELGFKCSDLDTLCSVGSEYKNDINLLGVNISIKGKLKKSGDIILINKKSTENHIIKLQVLLCIIEERKLYFIPSSIVDNNVFVKNDIGSISYKSKLISHINKNNEEYIYTFPCLSNENELILNTIQEIDIMTKLYIDTIKIY